MAASQEIIRRLEGICAEYITLGSKLNLAIGTPDLIRVVERVIATVEGEHPDAWSVESPHEAFLEGLVEELLDHPNTVSEIVADDAGRRTYKPLSETIWLETLREFRDQLKQSVL